MSLQLMAILFATTCYVISLLCMSADVLHMRRIRIKSDERWRRIHRD